jgi:uncharacterized protein (DUF1697 family)
MIEIETYIALLRGVNVAGQKKLAMSLLKSLLTDLGLMNVQTYIQSGNVVFKYEKNNGLFLKELIESEIIKKFDFRIEVILRTWDELAKVYHQKPFTEAEGFLDTAVYITFIDKNDGGELVKLVDDKRFTPDRFEAFGDEIYIYCPGGYGNTKLNNTYFERKLKKTATTRNLNTIRQLLEMGN